MKHKYNLSSFTGSKVYTRLTSSGVRMLYFVLTLVLTFFLKQNATAQSAQIYSMPQITNFGAEITPTVTGAGTSLGDKIVLGGPASKRVVDTIRVDFFSTLSAGTPFDLTISLYTDCSTNGTSNSVCGNGVGTLIAGSTQTISFSSVGSSIWQTATFVYSGSSLDLSSETDNTISVVLNSSSAGVFWRIGDSPLVGSEPSGEGATGAVTRCGSTGTNNGCARVFSGVQSNFGIEIKAHENITLVEDQSISCHGNTDGSIQASSSMVGSLTFDIDGANVYTNTSGFFTGLNAGPHTICVTNGTDISCATLTLIEPAALAVTFVTDSLSGCGSDLGGLSAIITGGTMGPLPGYGTVWTNSSSTVLNPFPDNYATAVTGLTAGVYSLHVEDYNFCNLDVSTTLQNLCLQIDQEISCHGAADGTIQASTSSTTGTWSYGIDGGPTNNTTGLFINLTPTTHTICMTDGTNTYCDTLSLMDPEALSATFAVDSLVSCHNNDGALTISISGGSMGSLPGYLTVWSNSTTNPLNDQLTNNYATSLTGLPADTYTVHVEDDHACVANFTTTLGFMTPVSVTASSTTILCNGGTSVITPSSAGGFGALTNTIAPGGTFTVLAGTYTVTATDTKGCTSTTEIVVSQPNALSLSISADSLAGCTPSNFGGLSAVISGGTAPFTTVWTNSSNAVVTGPTSTSITGLVPDTYSLNVTDANGCTANGTYYLPSLCLAIDQEISCHGQADGTVQATATSGYSWYYGIDGGLLTNPSGLFINLGPGTHTICASNDGGVHTYCDVITLIDPDPLSATFAVDSLVSCHNNDGALTISISGGSMGSLPGYLTVWSNSTTNPLNDQLTNNYATSLTGLPADTYTVHVEDDHACVANFTTTLGFMTPVSVTASSTTILCNGGTSVITPSSAGGFGALTNTIAPGGTFTVLAGTYTVTATDTKGCTSTTEIVVSQPNALSLSISADSLAGCTPSNFGGLSAVISGGTAPFTTVWTNSSNAVVTGPTSTSITGLVPDTYSLNVTDANGCTANGTYYLPSLCLAIDQEISCHGQADGTVQATATSGYSWYYGIDGGLLTNPSGLFINLGPGTHTICASNDGGVHTYCDVITLIDPDPLSATFAVDSLVSCHNNDGALTISISGGSMGSLPGYLTVWSNSTTNPLNDQLTNNYATSLTGLPADTYTVHVEDDHACVADFTTTLGFMTPVSVTASSTTILCNGGTSVITPSSAGGFGALTNTIAPGGTFTVLAGTYTVTATDTKGCSSTTEIVVTQPSLIASSSSATSCNSYTWASPGTGSTYTTSGSYTNTLVAANGCDSVITLNLTINYSTASSTTVHVANTYTWPVNGVTYTAAGTYTHTLVNASNCDSVLTLNLDLINLTLFIDQEISCNGANDGTVQASSTTTPSLLFGIDGGAMNNPSGLFIGLTPGTHTICATDGSSTYCETVSLVEPDPLTATFTVDSTVSCHNNDGMLTLNISGGTMGIGYLTVWTNTAGDTLNDQNTNNYAFYLSGLAAGDYFVHIEDDHACTTNVDTTLLFTTPLVVTASASPILCYGGTTSVSASSTDGYQPATYAIGATALPANFAAGTYTVTATDMKGCTATTVITLTQPPYYPTTQTETVCNTYTWSVNNQTYTTSGTYVANFTSVNGCDSSATLNLTVNYTTSSITNVTADGYTWPVTGITYTTSGTYTYTMVGGNSNGCDSILTLNFQMLTLDLLTDQDISCYGANDGSIIAIANGGSGSFTYDIDGGTLYTNNTGEFYGLTPGTHTVCAMESPTGAIICRTIIVVEPDPLTANFTVDSLVSCHNNDGMLTLNISGGTIGIGYLTVWTNALGDTVNDQNTNNYATNLGQLPVGTYNVHIEDDHGCFIDVDTVLNYTTPLVVTASASPIMCFGGSTVISASSTDGYQPATYAIGSTALPASFTAGTYTVTATDMKGCTATTVITLTQPPFLPITQSATACDTYTWGVNNQTYTTSGNYIANFTSVNGCDSSYSLNLTVNYSSTSSTTATACDTYTWADNGVTYTTSGTYTYTSMNASNCVNTATLNLTVNYSSTSSTTATACDTYTWSDNGVTYTTSGTYTYTSMNASNCVNTATLNLTVNYSSTTSTTATACNSYIWADNGVTYTTSGTYTYTSMNASNCVNTATLNLTVNYTTSSVENVTAANSYTWIANNVTYTASGTYTTTLVGGNSYGCDSNLTLNLNILNITAQVDQNVSCNGNNDGSLISAATGGSGVFTYDIDGGSSFTNTTGSFIGLTPGVHTVCAKESPSNVIVCTTVTITEPAQIAIVLTVDSTVSCLGNDGGISAVVTGGTTVLQPYLTTWTSGVTTSGIYDMSVTGLTPGTYTLTVEDDNLCFSSASITVGLTTPLSVTETHTPLLCYGQTSVITPTTTGGTGIVTTSITGGSYTVSGGTYTITATDAKGCTATTEVIIPSPILYAYSETQTSCNSYTWGVNSATYTTSGVYTASYTSVNGCDSIYTLNLTVNYSSSSVENVTVANTYTWIANGVTYTTSGTYTHTLVGGNASGCDSNLTLNLNILNIDVQVDQNVSCNGNNDGSLISSATGGSGNFTYDLDGANLYTNTTGSFAGLTPGVHTVCAKESPSNVIVCGTITITEPSPISIVLTVDSTVSCLGNDGGISAVVTGGTTSIQPYLTTWSAGATTTGLYDLSVTGLTPGMYTLTVEDDNLCFATASVNVGLTTPLSVSASYTPIQCYGGSTVITPVITGGTGTVNTTISGGTYTVTVGTYTITSVDAKGCTASTVVTLTQPALTLYYDTQVACNSYTWPVNNQTFTTSGTYIASYTAVSGCDSVYSLDLTINYPTSSTENVTAANSYTWAANGVTYTNEGTYTHTLVGGNSNGCDSNLTIHIHLITISVLLDQNISCFGSNDGSAEATGNGGTHNFVYDLDGANLYTNTTGSFVNLTPGVHTICVKELPSNVVVCGTVNVSEPLPITAHFEVDSTVSCFGNDGQLSIVIDGGTTILQPYLTTWTNSSNDTLNDQNTNNFATTVGGLPVGNYFVRVEDDLGCFTTFDTVLNATPTLTLSANATTILCHGGLSTISASSTGGLAPVVYTVGSTILPATFPGGTYTVTATDVKGCTSTAVLNVVDPPLYAYSQTEVVCDSYTWAQNSQTYTTSGTYTSAYTSVNGCDSIYTLNLTVNYSSSSILNVTGTSYTWSVTGITYTTTGVYTATLPNAAGCDSLLTLNFYKISIDVLLDQDVSCNGANDGSAIATAVGGTGNFSYDIDGANTYTNVTGSFYGLTPGTHTICAMESPSGAIVCGTVTVSEPSAISIVLTVDSTVSCLGNDGGISAVVNGGTAILQPYLTTWSGGYNSGSPYDLYTTGLTPGLYTLTVEDDHACISTASISVGLTPAVTVSATNTTIACFGGTSLITPTTGGGTGSITTTISGGSYTVTAGTYTITATDTKGCTSTTSITISEPALISSSATVTSCDSYNWSNGSGATYTASGTYTHTMTGGASNGCDSVLYLNLTINHSNIHAAQNVNACNTYTWAVNNVAYTTSGTYNATYTNASGCDSSYTLNLVVNFTTTSSTSITSTNAYTWNANNVTYTVSGVYTATLTNASGCDSILTLNLTIAGITISPKVLLDGPYVVADGMMHDSLRSQGLIPNTEPYSLAPFNKPNILDANPAEHQVSAAVLAVTGNNAIVDWVFVELRSATSPSTIVATKRALVQRDGDVVSSVDGVSPLYFAQNAPGNYYVSIKHRNHLGVMTVNALPLTLSSTSVDFTSLAPVYYHIAAPPITNAQRKIVSGVALLWAGDANSNKNVKYNGLANDKQEILNAVGVATPNNSVNGYRLEDVNMDGVIRYNNVDNDKNYILNFTVGVSTPNNVVSQHTPN